MSSWYERMSMDSDQQRRLNDAQLEQARLVRQGEATQQRAAIDAEIKRIRELLEVTRILKEVQALWGLGSQINFDQELAGSKYDSLVHQVSKKMSVPEVKGGLFHTGFGQSGNDGPSYSRVDASPAGEVVKTYTSYFTVAVSVDSSLKNVFISYNDQLTPSFSSGGYKDRDYPLGNGSFNSIEAAMVGLEKGAFEAVRRRKESRLLPADITAGLMKQEVPGQYLQVVVQDYRTL